MVRYRKTRVAMVVPPVSVGCGWLDASRWGRFAQQNGKLEWDDAVRSQLEF